ncbi:MAG: alpha/beta hydrolase [Methylococcales bacterium]
MEPLRMSFLAQFQPLMISIVGVYLLLCVLMFVFQDSLIFFPTPVSPNLDDWYTQHEVEYTHGSIKLQGWFIDRGVSETRPLIVYFGGNAEDISGTMNDFRIRTDLSLLFVPYRGYGKNSGKPSQKTMQEDALVILDQVVQKTVMNSQQIIVVGRSLGSGLATYVASKRLLKGVVLITPFDSLTNVAQSHYPFLPVSLILKHPFDSASLAKDINTPMLMLIADNDMIIANNHSNQLLEKWAGKHTRIVIANADHNDISNNEIYWEAIKRFITF